MFPDSFSITQFFMLILMLIFSFAFYCLFDFIFSLFNVMATHFNLVFCLLYCIYCFMGLTHPRAEIVVIWPVDTQCSATRGEEAILQILVDGKVDVFDYTNVGDSILQLLTRWHWERPPELWLKYASLVSKLR